MKISNQQVQRMLRAYAAEKVNAASQNDERVKGIIEPKDKVEFSELAQQLTRLRQDPSQPLIREERVQAIRQSLAEGNYNPDATSVSESIIKQFLIDRMASEEGKDRG